MPVSIQESNSDSPFSEKLMDELIEMAMVIKEEQKESQNSIEKLKKMQELQAEELREISSIMANMMNNQEEEKYVDYSNSYEASND